MQFRDTAQRGGAATETERAHPGRSSFQRPKRQLVHETLELVTRCGQDGRAPQNRRGLRRFGPILIDCKSALRVDAAKHKVQSSRKELNHIAYAESNSFARRQVSPG